MPNRVSRAAAAATLLAILGAGCTGADDTASDGGTTPDELEVFGPYLDREADRFAEVIGAFEARTGVDVRYVGAAAFGPDLAARLGSGDRPDVILLPQPGTLPQLDAAGWLQPLTPTLGDEVLATVGPGWEEAITLAGEVVAVPYRLVVKSLVWYRPDEFDRLGLTVPTTFADLEALTATLRRDGITPWCGGMNDFTASGWWGTDWVEDVLLRQTDADVYRAWSRLEVPFDGAEVRGALATVDRVLGTQGNVLGGRAGITNTLVTDAMAPMFADPPACLLLKQGSFQAAWLPSQATFGDNLDVFALPGPDAGPAPLVVGGEVATVTSENPAATDFVAFLLGEEAEAPWEAIGGSLAPRARQDVAAYATALDRRLVEILAAAPLVVFDASDLMPREVGSTAFWQAMTELVAGRPVELVVGDLQQAVTPT